MTLAGSRENAESSAVSGVKALVDEALKPAWFNWGK